ncbi:hypothetical protein L208DRAFT_1378222 [Tricholoma matsutake]|nr:hypothetical protein L208DRAFT_1378222 [Tricholoma matsutake 945]
MQEPEEENQHQDQPIPMQHKHSKMANTMQDILMFHGDEDQDKDEPQTWLRKLECACGRGATGETLMWTFEKSLEPRGWGEEWFDGLTQAEKVTWKDIMTAFKKEWPIEKKLELTREEKLWKLLDIKLKKEDLGEKVGEEGKKRWSHVEWVDKVRKAARTVGDTQGFLIPQVLDSLPKLICHLLPGQGIEDNWDKFMEAVKRIPLRKIEEAVEDKKQNEEVNNTVAHLLAGTMLQSQEHTLTMSSYTNQSTNQTYPYTPQKQQTPAQQQYTNRFQTPATPIQTPTGTSDPFVENTMLRPNNIMYGYRNPLPSPLADRSGGRGKPYYELTAEAVANSVAQLATEDNWKIYEAAMQKWIEVHREGLANYMTQPLPLMPGTAKLGLGEGFRCGKVTDLLHRGAECGGQPIPIHESNWQVYIAKAYNQGRMRVVTSFNMPLPTQSNQMAQIHMMNINAWDITNDYDPHIYNSLRMHFEEEAEQGNGGESC